jgi:hypothetical protein
MKISAPSAFSQGWEYGKSLLKFTFKVSIKFEIIGNRMNFRKIHGIFFVLGFSIIPVAYASAGNDAAQVPPLKLGSPQPRDDFYFKINSGAVFFRPPDKDNSNFSEAVNPGQTDGIASLDSQSGNDVTWSIGGTFGYSLAAKSADSWLGKNLRVEVSGNYFNTSDTQNSDLTVSPGGTFVTIGRLDGDYTGLRQSTDIGSITGGPNPVASETLTTEDEFYQAGMAFRSDYIFDQGQIVLSPKLGFEYSHLTQDFHTTASGNRGSIDQREEVNTDYFGPKLALELKVQLAKNFVYFAEGEMSPFYASSDYSGTQFGASTRFGGGALQNSATDSQESFAFKAVTMTGFYYDFGSVILKLGGGFEYWNYVATVQESAIPAGTDTVGGAPAPFTLQPSHLTSSDMLNPTVNMSVIFPF